MAKIMDEYIILFGSIEDKSSENMIAAGTERKDANKSNSIYIANLPYLLFNQNHPKIIIKYIVI